MGYAQPRHPQGVTSVFCRSLGLETVDFAKVAKVTLADDEVKKCKDGAQLQSRRVRRTLCSDAQMPSEHGKKSPRDFRGILHLPGRPFRLSNAP